MKDLVYLNKVFPYSEANGKPVHYAIPFTMSDDSWEEYQLGRGNIISRRLLDVVEKNGYYFNYVVWGAERTSDRYVIVRSKEDIERIKQEMIDDRV